MSTPVAETQLGAMRSEVGELLVDMDAAADAIVSLDTKINALWDLMLDSTTSATEQRVLRAIRSRKVAARAEVEAELAEMGTALDAAIVARDAAAK